MFPPVGAEEGRDMQRLRPPRQEVQEASGQLGASLGSRGGRQGGARGQELCQRATEGVVSGAEFQEEACLQAETKPRYRHGVRYNNVITSTTQNCPIVSRYVN